MLRGTVLIVNRRPVPTTAAGIPFAYAVRLQAVIRDSRTTAWDSHRTRRQTALAADWLRDLRDTPARFARPSSRRPVSTSPARRSWLAASRTRRPRPAAAVGGSFFRTAPR